MASPIIFKDVTYQYLSGHKHAYNALSQISFQIKPGSFTMIVGETGSGKSTLVQQIDGLLRPTKGLVKVGSIKVTHKMNSRQLMALRKNVGLVFQVSQDQLFGETVRDDLAFGPRNFGFSSTQIKASILRSAKTLGLTPQILATSPFDLSGGQMKRVAIASVLVSHPQILVLDEPTVGLDSFSEYRIMVLLLRLKIKYHLTIIMITHQMSLVAKYATQVLVMKDGKLLANVKPMKLFANPKLLHKSGLGLPFAPRFYYELIKKGIKLNHMPLRIAQLSDLIAEELRTRRYRE